MITCTRCMQQSPPGTEYCPNCTAYLPHWGMEAPTDEPGDHGAGLRVEVPEAPVAVSAGGEATADIRIHNSGSMIDRYRVDLFGEARDWGTVDPHEIAIDAGDAGVAVVSVRPPAASGAERTLDVGIGVVSTRNSQVMVVKMLRVTVTGADDDHGPAARSAALRVSTSSLSVEAGGEATLTVTVHNDGDIVDGFEVVVGGPLAQWASLDNSRFARIDRRDAAEAIVTFRPPQGPQPPAGLAPTPVSVRSVTTGEVLGEQQIAVSVGPFVALGATLSPHTGYARRRSRHTAVIENRGNVEVAAVAVAIDADAQLDLAVQPASLTVPWGGNVALDVRARPRKTHLIGRNRPPGRFTVTVEGGGTATEVDGAMVQKPLLPWWLLVLAAVGLGSLVALASSVSDDGDLGQVILTIIIVVGLSLLGLIVVGGAALGALGRLLVPGPNPMSGWETVGAGSAGVGVGVAVAIVARDVAWLGLPVALVVTIFAVRRLSREGEV